MSENVSYTALAQDIQGIEREYRQNVTVVTARPRVVQAIFIAWGACIVMMMLFFLGTVGWYGVQGIFEDRGYENFLLVNSAGVHGYLQRAAPVSVEVGSVQSVPTGSDGAYDVYVEIKNPNARHGVAFSYACSHAEGTTDVRQGFLNPNEAAYFLIPRATVGKPKSPVVVLSDVSWTYLSRHDIANVATWYEEHAAFTVSNATFARDITYTDSVVSRGTFTVTNYSPYAYWEPAFLARISRGSVLLGMAEITVARFKPGESRTVDLRFFGDLPQTATVSISPHIPYFIDDAYMSPDASTSDDVRSRWTTGRK